MAYQDESKPVYKILTEKIEKIDNQYYATFSYKSSAERFPIVHTDVLDNAEEAYKRLSEFKKEYEDLVNPVIEYQSENYYVENKTEIKKENKRKVLSQVFDFSLTNRFWWLGLILTAAGIIFGIAGLLLLKNADEEDKFAYSSGMWKGMFIISILMAGK